MPTKWDDICLAVGVILGFIVALVVVTSFKGCMPAAY